MNRIKHDSESDATKAGGAEMFFLLLLVIDTSGYTVWMVKKGTICPKTCSILKDAVDICINNYFVACKIYKFCL